MHFWSQENYFLPPENQYGLDGCRFPQIYPINSVRTARNAFLATRNKFLATGHAFLAARNAFLVARKYFFPHEIIHGLGTRRFPLILQVNAVRAQVFGFCMQRVLPVWDFSQLNPRNLDSSQLNPRNLDSRRLNPWNLDSGYFFSQFAEI
jgi:hypothetical protein